jgi:hypothetical protein
MKNSTRRAYFASGSIDWELFNEDLLVQTCAYLLLRVWSVA